MRGEQHRRASGPVHRPGRVERATFPELVFTRRPLERQEARDADSARAIEPSALEDSDRELVAAVLAGRRDRFEPLIARHGAALWAYLRRRTRDREAARELYQETLVRAFQALGDLREAERLRAWLISIAHNTLRQRVRRSALEPLASDDADGALASDESDSLERSEFAERAERELAKLSARQREVFELRVRQELSHAEIAELLDISEENSRAHYYQAVRNLRARLGEEST